MIVDLDRETVLLSDVPASDNLRRCARIVANPLKRQQQPDGRIRHWGVIPEFGGRVLRVITLEDGEPIHNAFPDRNFTLE